jgi:hypothetical protein
VLDLSKTHVTGGKRTLKAAIDCPEYETTNFETSFSSATCLLHSVRDKLGETFAPGDVNEVNLTVLLIMFGGWHVFGCWGDLLTLRNVTMSFYFSFSKLLPKIANIGVRNMFQPNFFICPNKQDVKSWIWFLISQVSTNIKVARNCVRSRHTEVPRHFQEGLSFLENALCNY